MLKVYEAANVTDASLICALLRAEGISAFVFDTNTFALAGSNPLAWPAVWIANDHAYSLARAVVTRFEQQRRASNTPPDWICQCGELLADSFERCWRCDTERPKSREDEWP